MTLAGRAYEQRVPIQPLMDKLQHLGAEQYFTRADSSTEYWFPGGLKTALRSVFIQAQWFNGKGHYLWISSRSPFRCVLISPGRFRKAEFVLPSTPYTFPNHYTLETRSFHK